MQEYIYFAEPYIKQIAANSERIADALEELAKCTAFEGREDGTPRSAFMTSGLADTDAAHGKTSGRGIKMLACHGEALRHLGESEVSDFWEGFDEVRRTGFMPCQMVPIARVLLYWVLSDNGIDFRDMPCMDTKAK